MSYTETFYSWEKALEYAKKVNRLIDCQGVSLKFWTEYPRLLITLEVHTDE